MDEPIAVIGMGCRLPGGVGSPQQFWDLLSNGRDAGGPVPPDRWNADAFYNPDGEAKESVNSKSFYFLSQDIRSFDARFFEVRPYEAHTMDPQQRIILETTYEALENAGLRLEDLEGSDTSVFVGVYGRDYDRMGYKDLPLVTKGHTTGAGEAVMSNRISYLLDLKGASMTIDTGCSGSMVALHQACLTLKSGASRTAIVGGTELLLHPDQTIAMSQVGMINPDGKCWVFDSRGDGYARGEGVGSVVIKLLKHAIEDGDPIHAVIRNTALNQDGRTAGISLPNSEAQSDLMEYVYASAGLDPNETLYVEAHGTGTQAGDKAEFSSISRVFCERRERESDLYVGSVKSNIGHLEASSGVAGLIKSILVLKKGLIPPHIGLITPKASLPLKGSKIKIAQALTPLAPLGYAGPLRVSVNSFGYGGTNCHLILDAAPNKQQAPTVIAPAPVGLNGNGASTEEIELPINGDHQSPNENGINGRMNSVGDVSKNTGMKNGTDSETPRLFLLSAASKVAFSSIVANLENWLTSSEALGVNLGDLSLTLGLRRSQLNWRACVVAASKEELIGALNGLQPRQPPNSSSKSLTFVFTGQGAQWYAMGRELIFHSPCFRKSIMRSDEILRTLGCEWSLKAELAKSKSDSRVNEAQLAQPSTTAIQIALVDTLAHMSVVPNKVIGHSSGEIAAAYAAGALDQKTAIEISYLRGLCSFLAKQANETRGAMMAVGLSEASILPFLETKSGKARVACVNSPSSVTLSGDEVAIDEIDKKLELEGVFHRKLQVEVAYHSQHMEKISQHYLESLKNIQTASTRPRVQFYSSVTGKVKKEGFDAEYWTANLVSKVQFTQALQLLANDASHNRSVFYHYIELGPHSALGGPIRETLEVIKPHNYSYQSALQRNKDATFTFLHCAGSLWGLTYHVNLRALLDLGISTSKSFHVIDNLPPYAWDHSTPYWHESRLSRDHRLRQFPYHDLLGVLDPMSSVHEPRWRYHLNLRALPWLKHHMVDGSVIFPGTGYMCMAIEGLKQLVQMRGAKSEIGNFILRNVVFSRALQIPNEREDGLVEEVEVQLVISPSKTTQNGSWESFKVLSLMDDGSWVENCTGIISTKPVAADIDQVEGQREAELESTAEMERLRRIQEQSQENVSPAEFYSTLRSTGNDFGPTFAALTSIATGPRQGHCRLTIPDVASFMRKPFIQPHVIHPSTLDALNHLAILTFKRECSNAPLMLAFIKEIAISADIMTQPGGQLTVLLEATPADKRSLTANTWTYQPGKDGGLVRVLHITGLELRAAGNELPEKGNRVFSRPMNYRLDWKSDVDFMSVLQSSESIDQAQKAQYNKSNDVAAAIYIRRALSAVEDKPAVAPHLTTLLAWMKSYADTEQYKSLILGIRPGDEEDDALSITNRGADVEAIALSVIGPRLPALLTETTNVLGLLKNNELLAFYRSGLEDVAETQLIGYIQHLAHKLPFMQVLEVNAGGSGAITARVLKALSRPSGILLKGYDYTDISAAAVEEAKESLMGWEPSLVFKTLDISRDPKAQGFNERYDLVIVSNGLNSMEESALLQSLSNIRALVKPGGRIVLREPRPRTASRNIIFGLSPSWCEVNDFSALGPRNLPSSSQWNEYFEKTGFTTLETIPQFQNIIISRSKGSCIPVKPMDVVFVTAPGFETKVTKSLLQKLSSILSSNNIPFKSIALESITPKDDVVYFLLDSASTPILAQPSSQIFTAIKRLLVSARNLLWVSFQEHSSDVAAAYKGLITGLARVVRRENEGVRLLTLELWGPIAPENDVAQGIFEVATRAFWPHSSEERCDELELAYDTTKGGGILVPRIFADEKFNEWINRINGKDLKQTQLYHQPQRPLKLEVGSPGLLHSMQFVDDPKPGLPLGPDEIEIKARAYGVNFRDVFIALGQMPPGLAMVGEVAGVVTAVGSNMADKYRVGDNAMATGAEAFSSRARVNGYCSHVIPQSFANDFAKAASIPLVFLTAYHSLVNVARMKSGQTVLIHAASGGVGQAAIQIAQYLGAEIFATVSSNDKKKILMDRYSLPESHIFSSRRSTFSHGIMRMTNNRGVDCILNSIAGETLNESWMCIAPLGTFVEIGKADMYKRNYLNMVPFDRSTTFAAVDMSVLLKSQPMMIHEMLDKLCQMMDSGITGTVLPLIPMSMENLESSFRLIATRKHTGKVILEADDETMVDAIVTPIRRLRLNPNAAYVIAGGLGDLGKRICKLLASCGAGHIITFSRRELDPVFKKGFENEVELLGSHLHIIKSDITEEASLNNAVEYCRVHSLWVKGIINGGAVLRDRPFELMGHDDWTISLGPKVTGTINLQSAFKSHEPDFFIMLSSISAILGKTGQANYAAGNAFMDSFALAHNGKSRTHFISLNLGAIEGSDMVSSVPNGQQELLAKMGALMMTFDELYKILEYAMSPQAAEDRCFQSVMGFDRNSMTALGDEFALRNPFFSMVPQVEDSNGEASSAPSKLKANVAQQLSAASSVDEVEDLVLSSIREKFALFLGNSVDEIALDKPVSTFGLDSLVAIELRNYMTRTFDCTIQATEISDALGLTPLAKLIASRSKLVSEGVRSVGTNSSVMESLKNDFKSGKLTTDSPGKEHPKISTTPLLESVATTGHGYSCCRYAKELPRQPIANFDEAVEQFYRTIAPFAKTQKEKDGLEAAIVAFSAEESLARKLHAELCSDARDPSCENWATDRITEGRWLKQRNSILIDTVFLSTHREGVKLQSQAARAALIASTAFRFKKAVESNALEPYYWFGQPACSSQWDSLFNVLHEAGPSIDKIKKLSGDFCVALSRGFMFKIALDEASQQGLESTFETILSNTLDVRPSMAGALTADNRDSWALTKKTLRSLNVKNDAYFNVIDQAAFVVCLDDKYTETNEDQVFHTLWQGGYNRWMDKTLQFVISADGKSSCLTDHSMVDGLAVHRLNEWIQEGINKAGLSKKHLNGATNGDSNQSPTPESYFLSTTSEIDSQMISVRDNCIKEFSTRSYSYVRLPRFGKSFLAARGAPIKGVLRLTMQLAARLFFGWSPPSVEPFSLTHFHKGRAERFQTTTPSAAEFCDAMVSSSNVNKGDLWETMLRAVKEISDEGKLAASGYYFDPLMVILESYMWPIDEPRPAIFADPVYQRTKEMLLQVDMVGGEAMDVARVPMNSRSFWLRYTPWEEEITASIVGPTDGMADFKKSLNEATAMIHALVASKI